MELIAKLNAKTAKIGIVGLGYVGLPLMLRYCEVGCKVIGFDVDQSKVDALRAGRSYIEHIESKRLSHFVDRKSFEPTSDLSRIAEVDALILCVPTPLSKHREPDLSFILGTIDSALPFLHPGMVISLESTTYPGTTDEELKPRIEAQNLKVGEDVFLVFSPEREDPGNQVYSTQTIPKVCGGCTSKCLAAGITLYSLVVDTVVPVSSTRAAELTKLLENIHRSVNIGLVNEMKVVADRMGIDLHEVIRAAATKPFGFVPYYPGPGIGGHCIPIDPFYLTWKAREYGVHTRFIELAGEINSSMPDYVVSKVVDGLNARKKSVNGSKILVLGIAYKKNVDDSRESPSVVLMEKLQDLGAQISYSDPHIPTFPKMRAHHFSLASVPLSPLTIAEFDCVLLATDHDKFDYGLIRLHAQLLVDCRGRFPEAFPNVVRA
ncbi:MULTISPECIES: nucleotide sugar dehydrogenase [unclassified Bradyrhizobium]|uniref:nucleotide sugar dehydrogenase n=1 Tax=unclassified Bradyrhizobium TaxID=2631580 RepID=UPI001FEF6435|nr:MULTISPECIES: nucleotide sugar dehydrogenase [unclassified Bradyrhizobium]